MKLSSPLLVLAIDYHQMFKALLDRAPNLKPDVDREIDWAKRKLKKQDRIVWYLRWVRLALEKKTAAEYTKPAEKQWHDQIQGMLVRDIKGYNSKGKANISESDIPVNLERLEISY